MTKLVSREVRDASRREPEGVPQLQNSPQEWGIKGVEKRSVQQPLWGSFPGFPLPVSTRTGCAGMTYRMAIAGAVYQLPFRRLDRRT